MFHPARVGDAGEGLKRNKTGGPSLSCFPSCLQSTPRSTSSSIRRRCLQLGLRGIPPIEQKTLDGWGTPMFHPARVGDAGEGLKRNKTGGPSLSCFPSCLQSTPRSTSSSIRRRCLQLGLRGIPPIEQKTLDGWGTPMFHPARVGDAGEGLIRNKTGGPSLSCFPSCLQSTPRSTSSSIRRRCLQLGLRGIPPIEQKTLDGWGTPMFHPARVGDAGEGLIRNKTGGPSLSCFPSCLQSTPRSTSSSIRRRCLQLGLRGIPPIEQKTLDGWGTQSFIPRGSETPVKD